MNKSSCTYFNLDIVDFIPYQILNGVWPLSSLDETYRVINNIYAWCKEWNFKEGRLRVINGPSNTQNIEVLSEIANP